MIQIKQLNKTYNRKRKNEHTVFCDLSFSINAQEFVAVVGESGSGKSTLLNILGGMDIQTSGEYFFNGHKLNQTLYGLTRHRRENISMIIQNFGLLNELSVRANLALPLKYLKISKAEQEREINLTAKHLGISHLLDQFSSHLSGGEKQRVAIGRAIIKKPKILLADEPTSSLDEKNKNNILEILKDLNQNGMTILIATHDSKLYYNCDKIIKLGE